MVESETNNKSEASQESGHSGDEEKNEVRGKSVIASNIKGIVKWFNVKAGYGFINR